MKVRSDRGIWSSGSSSVAASKQRSKPRKEIQLKAQNREPGTRNPTLNPETQNPKTQRVSGGQGLWSRHESCASRVGVRGQSSTGFRVTVSGFWIELPGFSRCTLCGARVRPTSQLMISARVQKGFFGFIFSLLVQCGFRAYGFRFWCSF